MWPGGEIHPFGGGGGAKEVSYKEHIPAILDINCLTHPELSFAQQLFPSKDIFQPAKICLKSRYFEEHSHWVPLPAIQSDPILLSKLPFANRDHSDHCIGVIKELNRRCVNKILCIFIHVKPQGKNKKLAFN